MAMNMIAGGGNGTSYITPFINSSGAGRDKPYISEILKPGAQNVYTGGNTAVSPRVQAAPTRPTPATPAAAQSLYSAAATPSSALAATAAPAAATTGPAFNSWLGQDATYTSQLAALQKALSDYNASENSQQSQYDQNTSQSLKDLGFTLGSGESSADLAKANGAVTGLGTWDLNNQDTASGRSYQDQQNDFASRGMLQSTGYAQKLSDLMSSLGEQASNLGTSQQNYDNGIKQAIQSYGTNNAAQQQQAAADALARYAAQYGATPTGSSLSGTPLASTSKS